MVHSVQQRVQQVNRRARRLTGLFAVSAAFVTIVSVAAGLGLIDYWTRSDDPGVRLMGSAVFLAVIVWVALRFLWPGYRFRPSELQAAQWIEQRYPELQNRLSSSLAFESQPEHEALAGSPELRRAVVAQATADLQSIDADSCLDPKPPRQMAMLAGVALLLVVALCWIAPVSSLLAARRLVTPWQAPAWPRRHDLQFVDPPSQLATGADFEIAVVDGQAELPEAVRIYYWFEGDSEAQIQAKEMKLVQQRMVHRMENVQRSFRYRAAGGDDDAMPWRWLMVVEPPRVESLSLRLFPPAYTGWAESVSGENILALAGTTVGIRGRLDKPATAVDLKFAPEPAAEPVSLAAEMDADGLGFSLPGGRAGAWQLERSGSYWFAVTDPAGLRGEGDRRWSVRVVPDAAPSVALDKPGTNTFVTAGAVVPIQAVVKDDLAIARVAARYRRGGQPEDSEQAFDLYVGPGVQPGEQSGALDPGGERGETRNIAADWDLAQLDGLQPGTWIELTLLALDYKPQEGQSTPRRLTIISHEELDERLAARQSYIFGQLAEVLRLQQETRSQTRSLEIQLETAGRFAARDIDQLQSSELNQRQVGRLLEDPGDGVAAQITAVLDELTSNRVDNPEAVRRMNELLAAVQLIGQQYLPEIRRQLIGAIKLARSLPSPESEDDPPPEDLAVAVTTAGRGQDEVIRTLEELLGELSQWDSYRRFAREIGRIRRDQQAVLAESEQLRLSTLGQRPEDLSPQSKADLKRQAERQAELARQLDKVLGRMLQTRRDLTDSEPLAAEMLDDALDLARSAAITGRMRESGRQIEANQLGQAVETQQQIQRHLQDLLNSLANRREQEMSRRLEGLDQAAEELQQLRTELESVRQRLEATPAEADAEKRRLERLAQELDELADESARLGRRLQRLQAEPSAKHVAQATADAQQAAQAGQQGLADEAADEAREAEKSLERAQQQLQAQRQQMEQDLFQERMARLQQQLAGLTARQQGLLDTTAEVEVARAAAAGPLSRAQLSTVQALGEAQGDLADATHALVDQVAPSRVFALGLSGAAAAMKRAAKALEIGQTGEPAQGEQRQAILRLQQLHEALKPDTESSDDPPQPPPPENGDPPNQPPPTDAIRVLAELKLLKWMQLEVNRQTAELTGQLRESSPVEAQLLARLDELAAEQGQLADLIVDLSRQATAPTTEDGPDLPPTEEVPAAEDSPPPDPPAGSEIEEPRSADSQQVNPPIGQEQVP